MKRIKIKSALVWNYQQQRYSQKKKKKKDDTSSLKTPERRQSTTNQNSVTSEARVYQLSEKLPIIIQSHADKSQTNVLLKQKRSDLRNGYTVKSIKASVPSDTKQLLISNLCWKTASLHPLHSLIMLYRLSQSFLLCLLFIITHVQIIICVQIHLCYEATSS